MGKICEIGDGSSYGQGGVAYFIKVQFNEGGQDIKLDTLNHFFITPFFVNRKLLALRKKHIGRSVHIYFNPDNKRQVLVREYMWKEFMVCVFLILLGIILL